MLRGVYNIWFLMIMKKIILLVVLVLSAVYAAQAQRAEFETIFSDEFHFIAFFPDRPTLTEGDINTRFGKGYSRRWTLESPGNFYEVSVDDFPDLSVKMDYKSLNSFYDTVCSDFASQYCAKCDNYHTTEFFGEYGKHAGGRTKDLFVYVEMYLVRQRLYQLKHIMRTSLENDRQALLDVSKFFNEFVLIHRKENEKEYSYGLPQSLSQKRERP